MRFNRISFHREVQESALLHQPSLQGIPGVTRRGDPNIFISESPASSDAPGISLALSKGVFELMVQE